MLERMLKVLLQTSVTCSAITRYLELSLLHRLPPWTHSPATTTHFRGILPWATHRLELIPNGRERHYSESRSAPASSLGSYREWWSPAPAHVHSQVWEL